MTWRDSLAVGRAARREKFRAPPAQDARASHRVLQAKARRAYAADLSRDPRVCRCRARAEPGRSPVTSTRNERRCPHRNRHIARRLQGDIMKPALAVALVATVLGAAACADNPEPTVTSTPPVTQSAPPASHAGGHRARADAVDARRALRAGSSRDRHRQGHACQQSAGRPDARRGEHRHAEGRPGQQPLEPCIRSKQGRTQIVVVGTGWP